VTAISLNRLAQHDVDSMIDRVIGNRFIPPGIREDIIERSDGIPLFVEEMTKAVLEAETPDEAARTAAAHPSPIVAVPPSLHASLMARHDRKILGRLARNVLRQLQQHGAGAEARPHAMDLCGQYPCQW